MPIPVSSIGRDGTAILVGPFGNIQMNITEFRYKQNTHEITSRPLNGPTLIYHVPDYMDGSFMADRNNNNLEQFVTALNSAYYNNQNLTFGQVFFYINELNGSQTTLSFANVSFKLSNGGEWKQNDAVKQTLEFTASTMQVQ